MMNFLISCLGYFLIFLATDWGRKPDSKLPLFSLGWTIQILLVLVGAMIILWAESWYPFN
jgi:hypothetical protein